MSGLIEKAFQRLDKQLSGQLSLPGDERYLAATAIWAKPVDRIPRAVAHCRTTSDVQASIRAARDCNLPLSVRGGGHDWAGRSLCNGIVIDLSAMNGAVIGPDNRVARIQGGARAADVIALTDPLKVAPVLGAASMVGVAGLTLGGGYGPLIGRCGLALDNLLAAEVVLADGRTIVANADDEADLFWALRGGGGNFGVVTTLRHRLHDLPSVHSGLLIFPFAEAKSVLESCVDLAAAMPEELTVQVGFIAGPDGAPVVFVLPTWCGRAAEGEAWVAPFAKAGTLLAGAVGKQSYGDLLRVFDPYIVNGLRVAMETSSLPALDSHGIDILIRAMEAAASPGCAIVTHEFKGAASRVATDATAFGLRRDHVLVEIIAVFPDRSDKLDALRHQQWARATREALGEIALPGGYPNLLAAEDTGRATQSFGINAKRLIAVKRQYDPDNVFRSAIPLPAG
ncbi:MAG TPA: FAD-binding oxidoreductase [Dongiaceae bacterium]|nr:FAD-binding oxidoreductase [Dongiaceae bacterium]